MFIKIQIADSLQDRILDMQNLCLVSQCLVGIFRSIIELCEDILFPLWYFLLIYTGHQFCSG